MTVVGRGIEKALKWRDWCRGVTWTPIDEVRGSDEGLRPEREWHASMDKKAADTVVECPYDALGFAVLSRAVGAGKAHGDAMGGKVLT